jgi:AcrR family transcriptional regulator
MAGPPDDFDPRRSAILDASAQLFAAHGFRAVSMADIGAAAGMSAASLYRHFSGKGSILATLWDRALSEVLDEARSAVSAGSTPSERLELIVHGHARILVTRQTDVGSIVRRGMTEIPLLAREALREKEAVYFGLWGAELRELRPESDIEISTRVVAGLAILHSIAMSRPSNFDDGLIRQLVAMAMAGMLVRTRTRTRASAPAPAPVGEFNA